MEFIYQPDRLYQVDANNTILAEIDFPKIPNQPVISITHTFVHPQLRGQGIANQLVEEVIKIARDHDLKIKPECSFAKKFLTRHQEYQTLIYHD